MFELLARSKDANEGLVGLPGALVAAFDCKVESKADIIPAIGKMCRGNSHSGMLTAIAMLEGMPANLQESGLITEAAI